MADRSFEFWAKALVMGGIVEKMPNKLPSRRETLIQLEKLRRMAESFSKKFPAPELVGMSQQQFMKKSAPARHRLTQQYKAVDKLIAKVLSPI